MHVPGQLNAGVMPVLAIVVALAACGDDGAG
jgi:predicted small lipoprotein YifL